MTYYLISENKDTGHLNLIHKTSNQAQARALLNLYSLRIDKYYHLSIYPPTTLLKKIKREAHLEASLKACYSITTKYFKLQIFNN